MILNKIRVLLTESEPDIVDSLSQLFDSSCYDIMPESDPVKVNYLINNQDYDIVFLDVTVFAQKTIDLIQSIFARNISTSIICACDAAHYDVGIEAIKHGACEVLVKPYDIQYLPDLFQNEVERFKEECQLCEQTDLSDSMSNIYKLMVESSHDIQYLLDINGIILYVNKRVESLLGFSRAELIGRHYSMLIRHDDLMGWNNRFHDAKRKTHPLRCTELPFNCMNKNNKVRYFDVTTIPLSHDQYITAQSLSKMDNNLLQSASIFGIAHDVTSRMKVEKTVYRKASYDYLTGLPNKLLFYDRLNMSIAQAKRDQLIFSVMFLDIDDFKRINDGYGHAVGDGILTESAIRLRSCLRAGDTVARIGGDEFLILLPQISNRWEAAIIAKKFTDQINRAFVVDGEIHNISVSIGIALYPDDGDSVELLIKRADEAMYEIKQNEKNGYKFIHTANK